MGQLGRILNRALLVVSLLSLVALGLSGTAAAKTCTKQIAPPGHAGSTQYYETVPTSCGNASPPAGGSGEPQGSIGDFGQGASGTKALSHLGTTGKSAAALAAATAPPAATPATTAGTGVTPGTSRGSGSGSVTGAVGGSPHTGSAVMLPSASGSAGGALGGALTGGGGGLGVLLPILLGLLLAAAIALGIGRAGRPSGPSA